jgi:anaphase-promoting complex subunit 1
LIQCRAEELIPQDELDKQPTIGELMASGKEAPRVKQMAQPMLPHVRFGSDKRLAEVERIMQTTRARTISVHDLKVAG